jgi:valyl-tRNA synthetase
MGRDVKLSTERIAGYRNFTNKLWNASRFALMNLDDFDPAGIDLQQHDLSLADRWILTRISETLTKVEQALTDYKFNEAASVLYSFTWHEFCDWYIELIKDDLYGDDQQIRHRAQSVLFIVLEQLLRLLHPFMPFITEEIWHALPGDRPADYLMQVDYVLPHGVSSDEQGAAQMELVMDVIRCIRNVRGEMDVAPAKKIKAVCDCKTDVIQAILTLGERYIATLGRVDDLQIGVGIEHPEQAATQVTGDVEILLPLAGLVNIEEEEKRLEKEIAKSQTDVDFFLKKLSNKKFTDNAPPQVLEKDRNKLAEGEEKLAILKQSLVKIQALK